MKEQLYTMPVLDGFKKNTECPLCTMKQELEHSEVAFTMGSSYMEESVRTETDQTGFCSRHMKLMYLNQNRLGLALILKTHMEKTRKEIQERAGHSSSGKAHPILWKKKKGTDISDYIHELNNSCFICKKVNHTMERYAATIFHLYKHDSSFSKQFAQSKGFCMEHYGMLYEKAPVYLSKNLLDSFLNTLDKVYLDNLSRVISDLSWFIDKFDYRFVNEPWKNAKDALPRAINKTNSYTGLNDDET